MPTVLATSAQGPDSPAFRIRVLLPAPALTSHGLEVRPAPLFTRAQAAAFATGSAVARARILLRARRTTARALRDEVPGCSSVLVQRQADMLPTRSLERLAAGGRRLVYDVDDAIWHDTTPGAGGHALAFLKDSRRKARWLASRADAVIAGNEMLATWLEQHAPGRVAVVPSLVDTTRVAVRRHEDSETLVLGWIGSASTARHLAAAAPRLASFARAYTDRPVELLSVGGPAPPVPGMRVHEQPWSEGAEAAALARIDIGLMPLPDDAWTRGKCSYKALLYMSAGVPAVVDRVGLSAAVVGHREGGLVAESTADWVDALLELARDPGLRARLGGLGRARVEQRFSVDGWAARLALLLLG